MSPAFDLIPDPHAHDRFGKGDLAMACGSAGRYANRENLLSRHGRFLLSAEEVAAILDRIVYTVQKVWRPTLRRAGVAEADRETIARAFLYEGFFYRQAFKMALPLRLELDDQ